MNANWEVMRLKESIGEGSVHKIGNSLIPKHYLHSRRTDKDMHTSKSS